MIDVGQGFSGVHMESGVEFRGGFAAASQCLIAEREGRMQAEEAAQIAFGGPLAVIEKRPVLGDALRGNLRAIAVGDFIAETGADAGLARGLRDTEKTS